MVLPISTGWQCSVAHPEGQAADRRAAWMNADYSVAAAGFAASSNVTGAGWTIGAGAEYMIAPNWSAKIEYNYLDFGNDGVNLGLAGANFDTRVHEVKVGLNYYFLPGTLFSRF